MTVNVALGTGPIPPVARSNDRSATVKDAVGDRFEAALAGKESKRKPPHEAGDRQHFRWQIEKLAGQFDAQIETSPDTIPPPDADHEFEAVLGELLGVAVEPDTPPQNSATRLGNDVEMPANDVDQTRLSEPADAPDEKSAAPQPNPVSTPEIAPTPTPLLVTGQAASIREAPQPDTRRTVENRPVPKPNGVIAASSGAAKATERPAALSAQPAMTANEPSNDAPRASPRSVNPDDGNPSRNGSALRNPDAAAAKVNVLSVSASLPPIAPAPGATVSGLVSVMENDPTWRSVSQKIDNPAEIRGTNSFGGVNTLRIQLNPAELGMVTARLTAAGEQLSVEIRVETSDARQRLTADSDAIVKALRAVGYDVERVTITQSSQNASGNAQQGAGGRDQFMQNQQSTGDGNARNRSNSGERSGSESEGAPHGSRETASARAADGVYI